jgi:hypothetical protein
LSKCALKFLAELFGGIFSWRPAPAFYSHFARNFSDPVAIEERVFRADGFHNLVDTGERVLLLHGLYPDPAEDFGIHLGALAPRGERNVLIVSMDALLRISFNPFFPYMLGRIEEGITEHASR